MLRPVVAGLFTYVVLIGAQAPDTSPAIPAQKPATSSPAQPSSQPGVKPLRLTIEEAEQLALKNNPRVSQAQYEAKAYDEVAREFPCRLFPNPRR